LPEAQKRLREKKGRKPKLRRVTTIQPVLKIGALKKKLVKQLPRLKRGRRKEGEKSCHAGKKLLQGQEGST